MDERVIHLEDGSTVSAKVNFGTIYYIKKFKLDKLLEKEELTEDEELEAAAKMIHVILMSNGRTCTFEEALVLTPLDDEEIQDVMNDFKDKLEELKKKREARAKMKQFTANQSM